MTPLASKRSTLPYLKNFKIQDAAPNFHQQAGFRNLSAVQLLIMTDPLQSELKTDEVILWQGKPSTKKLLSAFDIFLIPFSLVWASGVFFQFLPATNKADTIPTFFVLPMVLFAVMAVYITVGRFFLQFFIKKNTIYAITNKRVIVITNFIVNQVKSLNKSSCTHLSISKSKNGLGTIKFDADANKPFADMAYRAYGTLYGIAFIDVEDVESVYKLVND